jgi:hypothetical protein
MMYVTQTEGRTLEDTEHEQQQYRFWTEEHGEAWLLDDRDQGQTSKQEDKDNTPCPSMY